MPALPVHHKFRRRGLLLGLVDSAAAYYCAQDFGLDVLGGRDFCQVIREDDEVGVLACFQGAFLPFFELGVRGACGVGTDAIVQGDFFLGLPAAGGAAFGEFAGDTGVETAHGVDGLDVVVGAKGEMHAVFLHGGPGVGAFQAVGTDALFGPAHVSSFVGRLHGGDDVEFGEAGKIFGGDDLGVLDAITAVSGWVGFSDGFEDVEGYAIGFV